MNPSEFKILIVDDSLLARKKLKDCLTTLNYTNIVEASDGVQAVELFKTERPRLVFMDIVMPNEFGIDALKDIKRLSSDVIVIMLSSTGTKANLAESIKAGADDFVPKPFTTKQIAAVLERFNH